MKKELRFHVDKLTNSIESTQSGESFATLVLPVLKTQIRTVHRKDGWFFNWKEEFRTEGREVFQLVITGGKKN